MTDVLPQDITTVLQLFPLVPSTFKIGIESCDLDVVTAQRGFDLLNIRDGWYAVGSKEFGYTLDG